MTNKIFFEDFPKTGLVLLKYKSSYLVINILLLCKRKGWNELNMTRT